MNPPSVNCAWPERCGAVVAFLTKEVYALDIAGHLKNEKL